MFRHRALRLLAAALLACMVAGGCRTQTSQPEAPEPTRTDVVVNAVGVPEEYREAFAGILGAARDTYEEGLGLELAPVLTMELTLDPTGKTRLWTDGESRIYLTVTSMEQLAPSPRSGVFNIYGVCHELGHMAMYRRMRDLAGLPGGVGEGWAHYAGSVVVDAVAEELGDEVWPEPYDIASVEGSARLARQVEGQAWEGLSPSQRAAKVFYDLQGRYGEQLVCRAMDRALDAEPTGLELMPRFVEELRKLTGEQDAGDWIPENALEAKLEWHVEQREVDEAFFDGLSTEEDDAGIWLSYDDGTSEGKKSTAGSGHAVLFRAPKGNWAVDRVSVFGSRYGPTGTGEFQVYVCDEEFEVLRETARDDDLIGYERQWWEIEVDRAEVPEQFYVCLSFSPTATRGVFVEFDESVERSHSRSALPYSHVSDVGGRYDWMVRVHVVETSGQ